MTQLRSTRPSPSRYSPCMKHRYVGFGRHELSRGVDVMQRREGPHFTVSWE